MEERIFPIFLKCKRGFKMELKLIEIREIIDELSSAHAHSLSQFDMREAGVFFGLDETQIKNKIVEDGNNHAQEISELLDIVKLKYKLRKIVADANHENGINDKLTELAEINSTISILSMHCHEQQVVNVHERARYIQSMLESENGAGGVVYRSSILLEPDYNAFKKMEKELKRKQKTLQSELTLLNNKVKVNVDFTDKEIKLLKKINVM